MPIREALWVTISGMSRRSTISPAIGRQIRPRPWAAMKLMSSAVTSSAAMVRSPSFSRSSSSQTMTILPRLMSSMISSIGLNGISYAPLEESLCHARLQEPLHVLANNVGLQVYPAALDQSAQVRVRAGLGQDRDRERGLPDRDDGQADPVHADTALLDAVTEHRLGRRELPDLRLALGPHAEHLSYAIDVPLHDVPPEPALRGHRPLQVDGTPLAEGAKRRAPQRLRHGEERERPSVGLADRQASPVHRDAVAGAWCPP